ncbi:hypothetical protein [Phenylobacterium sp.]|jgi:hypothetical protein|uniref:hypothetical protein n=1 Tax=Phenylobacterium sp. TaxID=1871053 RepID=UPI002E2F881F|nr:hypothetical protein [Phenylobacterium sp.]HEX3364271.1 hypothetical protein [Phenylobacterium sp.]
MFRPVLAALLPVLAAGAAASAEAPDYSPLQLYEGAWKVVMPAPVGPPLTVGMVNSCGRVGANFACQQALAGVPGAMTIFMPTAVRGAWRTRIVSGDGLVDGPPGELTIDGPVWTFLTQEKTAKGVTWTRNINRFVGADRIHFEVATSPDGKTWTLDVAGDEVRVPPS